MFSPKLKIAIPRSSPIAQSNDMFTTITGGFGMTRQRQHFWNDEEVGHWKKPGAQPTIPEV